jgi:hypothetical protein
MGFLLKIAIFAVAGYVVWTSARRMLGLGGSGQRPAVPPADAPASPPATPRPTAVEDTRQCPVCGAFVAAGAAKCGRSDCPLAG